MKLLVAALVLVSLVALSSKQHQNRISGTNLDEAPQPGETVVQNNVVDAPGVRVEAVGVCKVTDGELSCWTPAGNNDPKVTSEIRTLLNEKGASIQQVFNGKFGKKNRLLVMKKEITDSEGNSSTFEFPLTSGTGEIEGWEHAGFSQFRFGNDAFKVPRTEIQFASGWFEKYRVTFPLRFHALSARKIQHVIRPTAGEFSQGGNLYRILSVSSKPSQTGRKVYSEIGYGNENLKHATYVRVMPVRILDPDLTCQLLPAGQDGRPFAATNRKDDPIYESQVKAFRLEQEKRRAEINKSGRKPDDNDMWSVFDRTIGGVGLDPKRFGINEPVEFRLRIDFSKVKSFSLATQSRSVYVFDKIKLDAN